MGNVLETEKGTPGLAWPCRNGEALSLTGLFSLLGHRVYWVVESIESIGSVESGGALGRGRKAGGYVEIDGVRLRVRAGVHTLPGCWAHADQIGLMDWVASMPEKPGSIRLVHGEARARKAPGERLRAARYRVE